LVGIALVRAACSGCLSVVHVGTRSQRLRRIATGLNLQERRRAYRGCLLAAEIALQLSGNCDIAQVSVQHAAK
jgi:hypothetical protein